MVLLIFFVKTHFSTLDHTIEKDLAFHFKISTKDCVMRSFKMASDVALKKM